MSRDFSKMVAIFEELKIKNANILNVGLICDFWRYSMRVTRFYCIIKGNTIFSEVLSQNK